MKPIVLAALATLLSCASSLPSAGPLVKRDTCGKNGGMICPAPLCCSSSGYCGTSLAYCSIGCQIGYGNCIASSTGNGNPPNVNYYPSNGLPLVCGPGFGGSSCPGSLCCSVAGYCGQTAPYCGIGCNSAFGSCWNLTSGVGGGGNGASNGGVTLGPNLGAVTSTVKPSTTTTVTSAAPMTSVVPFDDTCGPTPCAPGLCCSKWGYCGTSALHCSPATCKYSCAFPAVSVPSSMIPATSSTLNWSASATNVATTQAWSWASSSVFTGTSSESSETVVSSHIPQSSFAPAVGLTSVYATPWTPVTRMLTSMTPFVSASYVTTTLRSSSVVLTSVSQVLSTSVSVAVSTAPVFPTQSASPTLVSATMWPSQMPSVVTAWSTPMQSKTATFKTITTWSTTPSAMETPTANSTMPTQTMRSTTPSETIWSTFSPIIDPVWTSAKTATETLLISPMPPVQTIWLTVTSFIETESTSHTSTAVAETSSATLVPIIDPVWPSIMPTAESSHEPVFETLWLTVIETVWPSSSPASKVSLVTLTAASTSNAVSPMFTIVAPAATTSLDVNTMTTTTSDPTPDKTVTPEVSETATSKRKKTRRTHVVATPVVGGGGGVANVQITMTPSASPVMSTPVGGGSQVAQIPASTTTLRPETSTPVYANVETPPLTPIAPPLWAVLAPLGGRCGNGIYCQPGQCCSVFGYCGITSAHCNQPTCYFQCK